ncbi:MAG: Fructosamine kinase family protein [Pseudomonadota bacterium]|nr:Fructosamine kinase family protein [Pseudomonadota bacterium]
MKAELEAATGLRFRGAPQQLAVGGGFATGERWESDSGPVFVKVVDRQRLPLLEAEAAGLRELADAAALRVPRVLAAGVAGSRAFLALEWIEFRAATPRTEARLGELLAAQHRVTATRFGWHRDNTIGATPQSNAWTDDWTRFFAEQRLGFQLDLAVERGHSGRLIERGRRLCERLDALLRGHRPLPSLLHGDLWGGNWAADESGNPVVFDPAVYFGDREADLAMTRLFGGFGRAFYQAYESVWPLAAGATLRFDLYNLYHVLNHLNLFGGGYRAQAEALIDRLLQEA